jgi:hypothetical protein
MNRYGIYFVLVILAITFSLLTPIIREGQQFF